MTRQLSALTALGLGLFTPSLAGAHVFDSYGQGASTLAIGNATTASGPTAFAAYSNPALLPRAARSELSSHVLWTRFQLADLPESPGGRLPSDPFSPDQAEDLRGMSLGLNLRLQDSLHFGLAAYLPQGNFGRIKGLSPYQAGYLRYSEQQQKPAVYTALGVELPGGFSLGAGAYYSLQAKGLLQVSLSDRESEGRFDLVMEPVVVPYGGLQWTNGIFSLGAVFRQAQESRSEITSSFAFGTDEATLPFDASTSLVPFYDPALVRLGMAVDAGQLQIAASVEQARWSRFKAPLVTIYGNDVAALSEPLRSGDAGLRDTLAYRVGAVLPLQVTGESRLELKAGLERHTSANDPNKSSHLVDPERRSAAMGAAWSVALDPDGKRIGLEAAYQHSLLMPLTVDTPKGTSIDLQGNRSIQTLVGGVNYVL